MKKTKIKLQTKSAIILFIVIFAVLYAIIYIVPKVTDIFTQTYTAEYGTLESVREAECVIVRDEKVFKSGTGGSAERKQEAGRLVRSGTAVVSVGGQEQYADLRGIVSYYYDGFESRLTSENIGSLKESFIEEYRAEEASEKEFASQNIQPGDPIFKIIDNSKWFLVCWLGEEDAEQFEEGYTVKAAFGAGEAVAMNVYSKTKQGEKYQIVLSCNRSYEDFDRYRIADCRLITSSRSGIILETDSIVEKDGVKGVYVVNKLGKSVFTPVSILSSHDGRTVVEKNYYYDSEGQYVATVESYDEILKQGK